MNNLIQASEFIKDIDFVMQTMIAMDKEIGKTWKWPDTKSCLLYALTESAEFVEAYLLSSRPTDSRNNKKQEDFDSATELFDVTMMLLRAALKSSPYLSLDDAREIIIRNLTAYVEKNIEKIKFIKEDQIVKKNIHYSALSVCMLLESSFNVHAFPDSTCRLLMQIYFSDFFSPDQTDQSSYQKIATKKLEKIYLKNLAKQQEAQTNAN